MREPEKKVDAATLRERVAGAARPAGVKITRRDIWRQAHTRTRTCHVFYAESSRGDRGSGIESLAHSLQPGSPDEARARSAHSEANGTRSREHFTARICKREQ